MVEVGQRPSSWTDRGTSNRPKSSDDSKSDMWSSMLDGVASGKRLPEKNIVVLGGSTETQKDFLESLSEDHSRTRRPTGRHSRRPPPIANQFVLGYTYHDILDADHEDILARLSLYLLADPSPVFAPLLKPHLTKRTIPNTLVVIILDWATPWLWLRQLRDWIRMLRSVTNGLDNGAHDAMEEVMMDWRDRRRGAPQDSGGGGPRMDAPLPLGPGEWDEALGLPLCVVCQNSDKIDTLDKERGWREEDFDFVLQSLRTVLLKHGASLIYTTPSVPSSLQPLIHFSLGIQSPLKRDSFRHNIIDRDKILIPPNWDSWGKIRILREGFEVEAINAGWSVDIQPPRQTASAELQRPGNAAILNGNNPTDTHPQPQAEAEHEEAEDVEEGEQGALSLYEQTVQDPKHTAALAPTSQFGRQAGRQDDVKSTSTQDFLAQQIDVLEKLRVEDHTNTLKMKAIREELRDSHGMTPSMSHPTDDEGRDRDQAHRLVQDDGKVNEHIGPVHFNMGGIQVDAEDVLKGIKEREASREATNTTTSSGIATTSTDRERERERETPAPSTPDAKSQNEALASFFAGLMKRGGAGGAAAGGGASSSASPR
ncbi:hypothetical protein L228DRAFT_268335 [Xylona heveae TC161]|uniref:Dynein light intermediate chain n=1 Tax=Xylona heveae (strain CBS 132557 / TC161) TaxID=1328760 RepID=A0A165H4C4_XYLHT|nr:hypothetical protein L228DRAFT_268335 [Xylona heveae TC161]KZF22969.1 hypothetical protein L228DRAFT_268335 [Xylona heveae TC161]